MSADAPAPALWMAAGPGGTPHRHERGLAADAAGRVRCLYCASKPMVAMTVLSLLEVHGIELGRAVVGPDGRVEETVPAAVGDDPLAAVRAGSGSSRGPPPRARSRVRALPRSGSTAGRSSRTGGHHGRGAATWAGRPDQPDPEAR
jgi:hypothetical protein